MKLTVHPTCPALSLSLCLHKYICMCVFLVVEDRFTIGCGTVYPGYIGISVGLCDLMDGAMTNFCLKYIFDTGSQTPGYY